MKFAVVISYDGSKFYGFQRLNDLPTVQKSLEDALTKINKKNVEVKGSGRTDRGVHALGQVAHFSLDIKIGPESLKKALNKEVGKYITILDCILVDDDFHSRFSVLEKTYIYRIYLKKDNPFLEDYFLCYETNLDIRSMKKASKKLLGAHSYHNFVAGDRDNSDSIIYDIKIKKVGDFVTLYFTGKSFYRYMVRNLVGLLLDIGKHKQEISYVDELFEDKKIQVNTAPPCGLYLLNVKYDKKYNFNK